MTIGHHVCMRLVNDAVIAPDVERQRLLARVVLTKACGSGLLAFGLADNHLHLETSDGRAAAGELARVIEISLGRTLCLEVGFAPAYIKPITDARHLYATFRYVLRQPMHHELSVDPRREASNLPDLLGLRTVGAYSRANVRQHLPRIQRADLLALLGVTELDCAQGPVEWIVEAALAAVALPDLRSKSPEAMMARRAIAHLADRRVPARTVAAWLGVREHGVSDLRRGLVDEELAAAIARQLDLMARIGPLGGREVPGSDRPGWRPLVPDVGGTAGSAGRARRALVAGR